MRTVQNISSLRCLKLYYPMATFSMGRQMSFMVTGRIFLFSFCWWWIASIDFFSLSFPKLWKYWDRFCDEFCNTEGVDLHADLSALQRIMPNRSWADVRSLALAWKRFFPSVAHLAVPFRDFPHVSLLQWCRWFYVWYLQTSLLVDELTYSYSSAVPKHVNKSPFKNCSWQLPSHEDLLQE